MRLRAIGRLGVLLLLGGPPAGLAGQTPSSEEGDRMEWLVAPYLVFPNMSGEVGVANQSVAVEADPGDIFSRLQFGAMLYVEARKGDWGGSFDGLYMNLEQDAENANATAGAKQAALEFSLYRHLGKTVSILAGARVNILNSDLDLNTIGTTASATETWVDPFIGARLSHRFGESRWSAAIRGDIGGFGVGSDLAWQVYPVLNYRASRLLSIHLGYRALDMDYETGSGAKAFEYDMTTFGPEIGFGFHL